MRLCSRCFIGENMEEGYILKEMTPEERREMLEKAIDKSLENGTWPMLLAVIGMTLGLGNNKEN